MNRPERHLGKLKREVYDDSCLGKMPPPGPHMKLAMIAWIAAKHGNCLPAGVPTGVLRQGRVPAWQVALAVGGVVLFAAWAIGC